MFVTMLSLFKMTSNYRIRNDQERSALPLSLSVATERTYRYTLDSF